MLYLGNFTDLETVEVDEMQYARFFTLYTYHPGCVSQNTFFKLGGVLPTTNPYAYTEERQCSGHIVRKIGKGISNIHVIRDDGTVWNINLDNFESVTPMEVKMI